MEKKIILGKRRNEYGKRIRKAYESHRLQARRGEIADLVLVRSEYSNTITTLAKDNFDMRYRFLQYPRGVNRGGDFINQGMSNHQLLVLAA